jgi:hypothetical protein
MCGSWNVDPWPAAPVVPPGQLQMFAFGDAPGDMVTPDERDRREAQQGLVDLLDVFSGR